jgi:predicted esterase YcpF (UPF0227 family)
MKNILYIHGFRSKFDPTNEKLTTLSEMGNVVGITIDYSDGYDVIKQQLIDYCQTIEIDLIVGTSMGGYMASLIGAIVSCPFVSINPVLNPSEMLRKYIGVEDGINQTMLDQFPYFEFSGYGLILLDTGDESIPYKPTVEKLKSHFSIRIFEGGNHRFVHMKDALNEIESHMNSSEFIYTI